jgi:hypothetical protein
VIAGDGRILSGGTRFLQERDGSLRGSLAASKWDSKFLLAHEARTDFSLGVQTWSG